MATSSLTGLLADFPAAQPPPGHTSNFVNPESLAPTTIITCAISMGLMLTFVSLRLYTRLLVQRAIAGHDVACILAALFSVAYAAVTLSTLNPNGRHMWDVPIVAFTDEFLHKEFILVWGYLPGIFFAKLSLFLLYLKLFQPSRSTRWLIYSGIVSMALFYIACIINGCVTCAPRAGQSWLASISSPACANDKIVGYVQSGFNLASDLFLLYIPVPVVWGLHLEKRKKIGVCAIFMFGILACVCSILNCYYRVLFAHTTDQTWYTVPVLITGIIETDVGIIVGCMPLLTSLLRNSFSKPFQLLSISYLRSRLRRNRKSSKGSSQQTDVYCVMEDVERQHNAWLETRILGSVHGKGKFMQSGEFPQRSWLNRSTLASPSRNSLAEGLQYARVAR